MSNPADIIFQSESIEFFAKIPIEFIASINYGVSAKEISWQFDKDNFSSSQISYHTFSEPGEYQIKLVVYFEDGYVYSTSRTISVSYLINQAIKFDYVPPPTFAGYYNKHPFKVSITSPFVTDHYIHLEALFSKSLSPDNPQHKWSFLKPQWRFLDLNGNLITQIKTENYILSANESGSLDLNGSYMVGVSGFAEFFFIDDIPNTDLVETSAPYSTIIATLETKESDSFNIPKIFNSTAVAQHPYAVLWKTPDYLKITENGIRQHSNPRWCNVNVPIIVNAAYKGGNNLYEEGIGTLPFSSNLAFCKSFPVSDEVSDILIESSNFNSINFSPSAVQFSRLDLDDNLTPGYFKGHFSSPSEQLLNVTLSAVADIYVPSLSSNHYNPYIWLSNLNNNSVICTQYFNHLGLDQNILPISFNSITLGDTNSACDISSIAALPSPYYQSLVLDSTNNKLYRVSSHGEILQTIDIEQIILENDPTSESTKAVNFNLDGNLNVFLPIENTQSILKISNTGNFVSFISMQNHSVSGNFDISFLETDPQNNLHTILEYGYNSILIKTDQNNNLIYQKVYSGDNITNLLCDRDNNSWMSLFDGVSSSAIEKLNSSGVLLSSFSVNGSVSDMTLDINQNLWFIRNQKYVNVLDNTLSTINQVLSSSGILSNICSNTNDTGFVLNKNLNQILVIKQSTQELVNNFILNPVLSADYLISNGDWSGFEWKNKFGSNYLKDFNTDSYYLTISGVSKSLDFYVDTKNSFEVFKHNENYDLAENLKSFAFIPSLQENSGLFDKYLPAIFGSYPFSHDDLGVNLYEKISNYISNSKDIDTCDIDQLYDIASMLDLDSQDFHLNYPETIARLMNLGSINVSRLWGADDAGCFVFSGYDTNKGDYIDNPDTLVSVGQKLVLKIISLNKYKVIQTYSINNYHVYTLNTLANSLNLGEDWRNYYEFYYYKNLESPEQLEGVIDWNNPQTTISRDLSSSKNWLTDEGLLETMLTYELYKGLNLLD